MSITKPVVFCFSTSGRNLGTKISQKMGGKLILPDKMKTLNLKAEVSRSFLSKQPIIGICATGIIIRILAPFIGEKYSEPPVVCITDNGDYVIPLLGGHNGANKLSEEVSSLIGAKPIISTGSYASTGFSLMETPEFWYNPNPDSVKEITVALLNNKFVEIEGYAPWLIPLFELPNVKHLSSRVETNKITIKSNKIEPIHYYYKNYALGVGCVRNCKKEALWELINPQLNQLGISHYNLEGIYSVIHKSDEPAIHQIANELNLKARFFTPNQLEEQICRLKNPSELVFQELGCHGVCEGSCLARAGVDGILVLPKTKSPFATVAIARIGTHKIQKGNPRGKLSVVGIGPGDKLMQSPEVSLAISKAEVLTGYRGYLNQLEPHLTHQIVEAFDLGQEEERCRFALETAGEGKNVVLICSGDSGIYAMNSLILELLEDNSGVSDFAKKIEVNFLPGISAFQAVAAKSGGLIGHDFCAISLSNLLTEDEIIINRIRSAAQGDFVISFYNPASKQRKKLFTKAISIILEYRSPKTPVVIAESVSRADESIEIKPLGEVHVSDVNMFTTVLIGNSQSRSFKTQSLLNGVDGSWVFSPRGYKRLNHK